MTEDRAAQRASGQEGVPERAGLVLIALILVAAVANLNLSVANVALPSIGAHFDSGQTTLDLIAVGYSLGLACSVLWLGALGDRYGRKLMLLSGTVLAIPFSLLAAYAPTDTVLFVARVGGGRGCGHGLSDDARVDHGALGPRCQPHEVDRAVVGHRRRDRRTRPDAVGAPARALLLGLGVPAHAAARGRRDPDGLVPRPRARERGDGAGRQPRRHPLARARRRADPRDQLRTRAEREDSGARARRDRARRAGRLLYPPAPGCEPALRPRGRGAPDVLGRRSRRHHRLRLADGRDVRRPAVPPERPRLLDARRRARDPPRRVLHGARRTTVGEDRRGPRRALHAPSGLCVRPPRLR